MQEMQTTGNVNSARNELSLGRKLMDILRISYTITFVLASVTGVALALTVKQEWPIAFLIPLDVFFLALFVNFSNDYFDHKSGVDQLRFQEHGQDIEQVREILPEKFYWSGNAFDNGLVTEKQGKAIMGVIAAMAVILAIPIVLYGGLIVLLLGAIGFFLSYFYTAPPINLGARGFGELDVAVSFAFISFFSYFVIVQEFSWEAVLIACCVGLAVGMVRIVDEMTGYEAHVKAKERNLCVILGLEKVVDLIAVLLIALYILIGVLLYFDLTYAVLFLTVPAAMRTVRYLRKKDDELRLVRPVPEIFKVAVGTEILIVIALIARTALTFA
jgi:1,4-dihydroxy-2-naphthoate octaprenyltransferase